jgi:hypothetical protein
MITIFTYKPTNDELEEITGYGDILLNGYMELMKKRCSNNSTPLEYEIIVDLQELFSIRSDSAMLKYTNDLINKKFKGTVDKIFNE